MSPITVQYIFIAAIIIAAAYSLIRIIGKNFAPKKFSSKRGNCDKDCGCSK